jgi:hypothetical protein
VTFAHPLGEPEPVAGFPQIKPVDLCIYRFLSMTYLFRLIIKFLGFVNDYFLRF